MFKSILVTITSRTSRHSRGIHPLILGMIGLAGFGPLSAMCATQHANQDQVQVARDESFQATAAEAKRALDENRTPEAIHLYELATASRPSWSEGWWYLGTIFFDSSQFTKAHDAFLHFVSVEHNQPGPGFGMLGLTELRLKDYKSALAAFERGIAQGLGDNADFVHSVLYQDGILNNFVGQPEIALVRLTLLANQIAANNPEAPKDAVLSDTSLLDAFGLAALRIRKLPSDIPVMERSLVRDAGHAQALFALQERVAAGAEFKQIVALHPSEPGVHYMYGVYLLKEDPPLAVEEFKREISVSPQHAAARIQLALEFLNSADYKEGLRYAQEAVALAPDNFVAHVACGKLLLELGNSDRAIHELRKAVRLSPGSPDAHFALSRALSNAGQRREAAQERAEFERLKAMSDAADRH